MAGTIQTAWSHQFGSADIEPPIEDAIADGGTQPVLQALYVAALHANGEEAAELAQFKLASELDGATTTVGRAAIEAAFGELGHSLSWLSRQ